MVFEYRGSKAIQCLHSTLIILQLIHSAGGACTLQWHGHPPDCGDTRCADGQTEVDRSRSGDGFTCLTGEKVLCEKCDPPTPPTPPTPKTPPTPPTPFPLIEDEDASTTPPTPPPPPPTPPPTPPPPRCPPGYKLEKGFCVPRKKPTTPAPPPALPPPTPPPPPPPFYPPPPPPPQVPLNPTEPPPLVQPPQRFHPITPKPTAPPPFQYPPMQMPPMNPMNPPIQMPPVNPMNPINPNMQFPPMDQTPQMPQQPQPPFPMDPQIGFLNQLADQMSPRLQLVPSMPPQQMMHPPPQMMPPQQMQPSKPVMMPPQMMAFPPHPMMVPNPQQLYSQQQQISYVPVHIPVPYPYRVNYPVAVPIEVHVPKPVAVFTPVPKPVPVPVYSISPQYPPNHPMSIFNAIHQQELFNTPVYQSRLTKFPEDVLQTAFANAMNQAAGNSQINAPVPLTIAVAPQPLPLPSLPSSPFQVPMPVQFLNPQTGQPGPVFQIIMQWPHALLSNPSLSWQPSNSPSPASSSSAATGNSNNNNNNNLQSPPPNHFPSHVPVSVPSNTFPSFLSYYLQQPSVFSTPLMRSSVLPTMMPNVPFNQPILNGHFTFFNNKGLGACGTPVDATTEMVAEVGPMYWLTVNPNDDPICHNVCVQVQSPSGKSVNVPVKDKCSGCDAYQVQLSQPAFMQIADLSRGHVSHAMWMFLRCTT